VSAISRTEIALSFVITEEAMARRGMQVSDVSAISRTEIALSFVITEEAMARRGMQVSRECSLFRDATSRAVAPSTSIVAIVALVSAFCAPPLRSVRASEFLGFWARAAKTLCVLCP
jgi:hypothetical protein